MFTYKKQTLRRIGKHDIAPLAISKGIAHCFIGEKRLWSLGLESQTQKMKWETRQYMTEHIYLTLSNTPKVREKLRSKQTY